MSTNRNLLSAMLIAGLFASGCGAWFSGTAAPIRAPAALRYPPPEPREEGVVRVNADQVWVHGYYEPMLGNWMWMPGRVVSKRAGYDLVEAKYIEDHGAYHTRVPHWQRQKLASK
jgi:hypothetical protein